MTTKTEEKKEELERNAKFDPADYSCEILLEKTTMDKAKDPKYPSDAFYVQYNKDGKTLFYNIENSGKKGDKNISNQSYKPNLETIFPIWSMSKPITIVAMMILRERGMISINDNLSKYIPEFKNMTCKGEKGKYPCKKEIKIIHLLTHSSGFGYYSDQGYGYGFTNTLTTTKSLSFRAWRTKLRCPWCKAPIVGTKPTDFP